MNKILITGAAGFIGYHLAKKISANKSLKIYGLDNFNDYYDVNLKKARANDLDIEIFTLDLIEKEKLLKIVEEKNITTIVHLAAQAGVRYSLKHPEKYIDSNILGFFSILEVLRKFPKIKLVFASSSSVYGLNKKIPFSVEDKSDMPTSLYGATKKANELLAHSYHHLYGIEMIGLRFFTVYGPFGRPDMAYFSFTKNILEKKPIKIFNHGQMRRDFTYIDDIINGIKAAINYKTTFEIFNLGNNKPIEILKFIEILENLLSTKAIKEFLPIQKEEVIQTFADISKSKQKLNFSPKYNIEKGLEKFISWYKSYY